MSHTLGFRGRREEIRALRAALDGRGPSLALIRGREGSGTTALVGHALGDRPRLAYTAAPLTDPDHRQLFAERLAERLGTSAVEVGGAEDAEPEDWPALLDRLAGHVEATREGTIVVLDGIEHLLATRSRLPAILASFWSRIRARSLPLHLVLAGSDPGTLAALAEDGSPLGDAITLELELGPLPFREVAALLSGWPPRERLAGWAVFGGMPAVLRTLDPGVGLAANVRRAVLDPDAPLLRAGTDGLRAAVQSPARYAGVLRALARGHREWGGIAAAVPDFTSSGQLAPYLARLEALGLVEVRRSLDARAGSRSRRYHLTDPFLAFWYRFVLPSLTELEAGGAADVWARRIRPGLDDHVRAVFPDAAREYLWRYAERLHAPAREAGALWGHGYDVEVAAILRSGAACYGTCAWTDEPVGEDVLEPLDHALRESRYGFGRESRLRVVFHAGAVHEDLARRAARDDQVRLIPLEAMLGAA